MSRSNNCAMEDKKLWRKLSKLHFVSTSAEVCAVSVPVIRK